MLYQTQQKMKKKGESNKKKHRKHKSSKESPASSNASVKTSGGEDDKSVVSREERSDREGRGDTSDTNDINDNNYNNHNNHNNHNNDNNNHLNPENIPPSLKKSNSASSLSSNIAAKFSKTAGVNSGHHSPVHMSYESPSLALDYFSQTFGDANEKRRNSTSTTASSLNKYKYRRNSSLSSSQTNSSNNANTSSNSNTNSSTNANSSSNSNSIKYNAMSDNNSLHSQNHDPDTASSKHKLFKPSFMSKNDSPPISAPNSPKVSQPSRIPSSSKLNTSTTSSPSRHPAQQQQQSDHSDQEQFPTFVLLKDFSVLNSLSSMQEHLFTPSFQVFRYNNFLDILSSQHRNDPINFANIRFNSISKFIHRHNESSSIPRDEVMKSTDIRDYENILAYDLLWCRTFLRQLIRSQWHIDNRSEIFTCEELVQVNFTNYIRFILNLPDHYFSYPPERLDSTMATHLQFKRFFLQITKALQNVKREDAGDEAANVVNSVSFLLQLITKVSYDFILLEKYHINILTKLSNNSLIDPRILHGLLQKYVKSLETSKKELVKVLVFNSYFSAQYSWYLSVTSPFLKVVEMNIFNEDPNLLKDSSLYNEMAQKHQNKVLFNDLDNELYDRYFTKLNIDDWSKYTSMSDEQLVSKQRDIMKQNSDLVKSAPDSPAASLHKPMNFEFYGNSLFTVGSETFDCIQSRDLLFQLTNANYRTILEQFFRILKPGGSVEIPIILSGIGTIKNDGSPQVVGFPGSSNTKGVELAKYYDMIPQFPEVLLLTLSSIFGKGNVKYSCVLLNTSSEINSFLAADIGLHISEMFGKANDFCKSFDHGQDNSENGKDVHFFFPIKAFKPV